MTMTGILLAAALSLNGQWKLDYFPQPNDGAVRTLPLAAELGAKTVTATVPGNCELDLAALGRPNARVAAVEALEPTAQASAPTWRQDGTKLVLRVDAHAFAYRIVLK